MSREHYMEGPGKGAFNGTPATPGKDYGPSYQNPGKGTEGQQQQAGVRTRPPSGLTAEEWDAIRAQSQPAEH